METLLRLLQETVQISLLVAIMMILVDLLNVFSRRKLESFFKNANKFRQYFFASLIGTIPGCVGGFTNVSLYIHGIISFGALAGSMVAVSGDEAFVMLAMFPKKAIILFAVLFIIGIFSGWLIDAFVKKYKIATCENCEEMVVHGHEANIKHYFIEHIYGHIIKKHLWKIALWTFGALAIIEFGLQYLHLDKFTSQYKIVFLFVGALVGLIPESGPHLIFVTLFAEGLIPFSVLLTSSIVQDGHGMIPMLSYSLSDSIKLKFFNFVIGITIGLLLFIIGF
ncbi:putative manganese transporter [Melioribacteraceae bacterium 4301-Me]|uniref:putative manganese transporter n=1 Tax=Pyranulibacter aquaticus TaxID=3163344 RepID=UPI0035957761